MSLVDSEGSQYLNKKNKIIHLKQKYDLQLITTLTWKIDYSDLASKLLNGSGALATLWKRFQVTSQYNASFRVYVHTTLLSWAFQKGIKQVLNSLKLKQPNNQINYSTLSSSFQSVLPNAMSFFVISAHWNVTRVENPLEVVSGLPRGAGFTVIGRRSAATWLSCPIQVPRVGDKMTDIRVVADLGESAILKRVHVWIGGRDLVFRAENLKLSGEIDRIFTIPGDPVLTTGINVSLYLEFGGSGNDMDRRAIIRAFDSQLETESDAASGLALNKTSRRLSSM